MNPENVQIAKAEDFKRAMRQRANVEWLTLPASGLSVLLCRPPVFAALAMQDEGSELQKKVMGVEPGKVQSEDVRAFTKWITATLAKLFVEPQFSASPGAGEVGLADIMQEDLRYIFAWMRGEVSPDAGGNPADLAAFRQGSSAAPIPRGSGEAQPLPGK
jgi:hypothetical protein